MAWQFPHPKRLRLGTTSYILPDDLEPNLRYLAPLVDDIELVIFESHDYSNLPSPDQVKRFDELGQTHDCSFTVHLPLDTWLGHSLAGMRTRSIDRCLRVIDRFRPLNPQSYILHFHGDRRGPHPTADPQRWLDGHRQALERLNSEVAAERIAIETLEYDFTLIAPLVFEYGNSICFDYGHLLLNGYSINDNWVMYQERVSVVHWHGVRDGVDHQSLEALPTSYGPAFLRRLLTSSGRPRVLTLEVFNQPDFLTSRRLLEEWLACHASL